MNRLCLFVLAVGLQLCQSASAGQVDVDLRGAQGGQELSGFAAPSPSDSTGGAWSAESFRDDAVSPPSAERSKEFGNSQFASPIPLGPAFARSSESVQRIAKAPVQVPLPPAAPAGLAMLAIFGLVTIVRRVYRSRPT